MGLHLRRARRNEQINFSIRDPLAASLPRAPRRGDRVAEFFRVAPGIDVALPRLNGSMIEGCINLLQRFVTRVH